jgi:hypothetical protein
VFRPQAHDVARNVAYRITDDHVLGQDYLDAAMPALEVQLLRGGVRLAALLNSIFDPSSGESASASGAVIGNRTAASTSRMERTERGRPFHGEPFCGNIRSNVYHAPGYPNYNCTNFTTVFATRQEAGCVK